jgi:hypothetical protein
MGTSITITPLSQSIEVSYVVRSITITDPSAGTIAVTGENTLINIGASETVVSVSLPSSIGVEVTAGVSTVITASTLALSSAGPQGIQGIQGVQGIQGEPGAIIVGTAQLNFGTGNKTAEVIVTGVSGALTTSRVMAAVRMEATASHLIDDLLIDPIRVSIKSLINSTGFTVYGEMNNAEANGLYNVDWFLLN